MNRAKIYQAHKPQTDITEQELQSYVKVNYSQVDPRFLRNHHLPVDPEIAAEKRKQYLEELERWTALEN